MIKFLNTLNLLGAREELPQWVLVSFPIIKIVIACLIVVCAIFMIISVLVQDSNENGMSALTGETDTFYNRNKGRSLQGKIKKLTVIDAVLLLVLCVMFLILTTICP